MSASTEALVPHQELEQDFLRENYRSLMELQLTFMNNLPGKQNMLRDLMRIGLDLINIKNTLSVAPG